MIFLENISASDLLEKIRTRYIFWRNLNNYSHKAITPNAPKQSIEDVSSWMMHLLEKDGCLYQQDVVDYLVKNDQRNHLKENADGNQALSTEVINKFRVDSGNDVV